MYIVNALVKLVLLFKVFGKRTNHILTVINYFKETPIRISIKGSLTHNDRLGYIPMFAPKTISFSLNVTK